MDDLYSVLNSIAMASNNLSKAIAVLLADINTSCNNAQLAQVAIDYIMQANCKLMYHAEETLKRMIDAEKEQ